MKRTFSKRIQDVKKSLCTYIVRNAFDTMGNGLSITSSGFKIGEISLNTDLAMKYTAVYAAIRLRSETIASLPKTVFSITPSGRMDAYKHDVYKLIKYKPNGFMNVFSFWEYTNACLDGWGNAYVLIRRDKNATPVELIPVHPKYVTVVFRKLRKWYIVTGSQYFDGTYSDDDVLHFFSFSNDGITGVNPIVYNAAAISTGISAQNFANEYFATGGNMKGVIESDRIIGEKDIAAFAKKFAETKNFGTPILDGGSKYKQIGVDPSASQVIETRTLAIQDIARVFNVPPHMLSDLSRATFSNIEHQDIQYAKYSIRPTVKRYEQEMDRKLFFENEIGKLETKMNLDGLMRGDMATRSAFYHNAIQDGWLSRNEVRELENKNAASGLDDMLYPANLNIVGKEQKQGKNIEKQ